MLKLMLTDECPSISLTTLTLTPMNEQERSVGVPQIVEADRPQISDSNFGTNANQRARILVDDDEHNENVNPEFQASPSPNEGSVWWRWGRVELPTTRLEPSHFVCHIRISLAFWLPTCVPYP